MKSKIYSKNAILAISVLCLSGIYSGYSQHKLGSSKSKKTYERCTIVPYKDSAEENHYKKSSAPFTVVEKEIGNSGTNDDFNQAEGVSNFGSRSFNNNRVNIQGVSNSPELPQFEDRSITTQEDNGSIPLATPIVFDKEFERVNIITTIGDGPIGSGDADFYSVAIPKGNVVQITVDPVVDSGDFVPTIFVLDSEGEIVAETFFRENGEHRIQFTSFTDDLHYVAIYDEQTVVAIDENFEDFDPFNSTVPESPNTGEYEMSIGLLGLNDVDFYTIQLEKGDILAVSVDNSEDSESSMLLFSDQGKVATSDIGPDLISPLLESTDGEAGLIYLIPQNGTYRLSIANVVGSYNAEVVASRPGLEVNKGGKQVFYLDFTGADLIYRDFFGDNGFFPEEELDVVRPLSPLSSFLENWGLENTRFNTINLAARITNVIMENIKNDFITSGINPNFGVEIISDYGSEYLGKRIPELLEEYDIPHSRVVIGGTIEESRIPTIGIAEGVDVGNFNINDDALLFLDVVSDTSPIVLDLDGNPRLDQDGNTIPNLDSVNFVPRADGVPIEDLIAVLVGNIASHEIGHILGSFHTTTQNNVFSLMDEGGGDTGIFMDSGVPAGEKFGDATTVDVDFSRDAYSNFEFPAVEEKNFTDLNTAYALSYFPNYYRKGEQPLSVTNEIRGLEDNVLAQVQGIQEQFSVYPNPASSGENPNLEFTAETDGNVLVSLYDLQGKNLGTLYNGEMKSGERKNIPLSLKQLNLKTGVYVYSVKTPNDIRTQKMTIK